jgi:hypothetical protein
MRTSNLVEDRERRRHRRSAAADEGIVGARIRPGHVAVVVDVSAGGALIETSKRLLPGSPIDLMIETKHTAVAVHGRILRCSVAQLREDGVQYRAAVQFTVRFPWRAGAVYTGYDIPIDSAPLAHP